MVGLGGWFGYDGFIRYPATPATELYRSIEGSPAPAEMNLEAFKRQKIQTQYGFTFISLIVALIVGLRLLKSYKFKFEFDKDCFTTQGKRFTYADIKEIDHKEWDKKRILKIKLTNGWVVILDAWHHLGVKDFEEMARAAGFEPATN